MFGHMNSENYNSVISSNGCQRFSAESESHFDILLFSVFSIEMVKQFLFIFHIPLALSETFIILLSHFIQLILFGLYLKHQSALFLSSRLLF